MVFDAYIQVPLFFDPMEHSYEAWQWHHNIIQLSCMLGGDREYAKFYLELSYVYSHNKARH